MKRATLAVGLIFCRAAIVKFGTDEIINKDFGKLWSKKFLHSCNISHIIKVTLQTELISGITVVFLSKITQVFLAVSEGVLI